MAIISFLYDFIFIKTTKTAGTSIEVDLSPLAGPDAVVTRIIPAEEGHQPRNCGGTEEKPLYFNHMPAVRVRELLGRDRYERMLSFCVEREPVEKCISHFHMLRNSPIHGKGGAYRLSWPEYVEAGSFPVDVCKYSESANSERRRIVDRILRYDALPAALDGLMAERGLGGFRLRSRAKSEYAHNRLITPDQVSATERQQIYEAFDQTLKVSGIDWDRPPR